MIEERIERQRAFWRGEGPSLILIPTEELELYDVRDYRRRFYDPRRMWEAEMARARPVVDWPTDGIPCVRPNLGTIFVPAIAGQNFRLREGQMPWHGDPLTPAQLRAVRAVDPAETELMRLAGEFYRIHRESGETEIACYHADTQGVFDIAHLLLGNDIFLEMLDGAETDWIDEVLEICRKLYVRVTRKLKASIGEAADQMVHGHGTPQGVFFPGAGTRMAEDTATLIGPAVIERSILPAIEEAARPFGGTFVHFCGSHPTLFEQLCRLDCVKAIDLGNPEKYELRRLLECCAETGTVLYSRLAAEQGENWERWVRRVAGLVRETGARCVVRPPVFPKTREECAALRDLWHELTG